ncbi:HU family DNA-binding protein [Deefgea piscis]|nr:HU family DNA-binding protein [Deefgea piscis]
MNKQDLIRQVAEATGLTDKKTDEVLNQLGEVIRTALAKGDEVILPGVGKLEVTERAARSGRNPSTGETIQIAASRAPKFKALKVLKDAINA